MSILFPLADIGAKALLLLYVWLGSAIIASLVSKSKGFTEKVGLGTGMLLSILGPIVWLGIVAKPNAEWRKRKPWNPRRKPTEAMFASAEAGLTPARPDAAADEPELRELAPRFSRVVALLIDGFVLIALGGLVTSPFGLDAAGSSAVALPAGLLYFALLEGTTGQTLGKYVCGVRVVDVDSSEPIGIARALLRTVLRPIDALILYLVVLFTPERRRIGDFAATSVVVTIYSVGVPVGRTEATTPLA